jgi:MFS family permease
MEATPPLTEARASTAHSLNSRLHAAAMATALLSSGSLLALMYTAASPILSEMAARITPGQDGTVLAQMFMTMPSLGMMLGGLMSAWMVNGLGARRLFLLALFLYGLCGSAGLVIAHAGVLLAARFVLGMSAAAVATGATTLLAERYSEGVRARLIGFQSSIGAVTGLVSTLMAGAVAELAGWRAPFAFYLIAWLIAMIGAVSLTPRARRASSSPSALARVHLPWRRLWPVYALCVPLYAAVFMTTTQVPFLLRSDGVASPSVQAWVLAMASMWNAIGAAFYGRVRERIGAQRAFALSLALMAAGQAVLGLSHYPVLTAIGCVLAGSGAGLAVPHVPNMVLARAVEESRGRALGLMYSALFLGSFCNPLLVAPVAGLVGRHGALVVSAAAIALCSATAFWLAGRRNPPGVES